MHPFHSVGATLAVALFVARERHDGLGAELDHGILVDEHRGAAVVARLDGRAFGERACARKRGVSGRGLSRHRGQPSADRRSGRRPGDEQHEGADERDPRAPVRSNGSIRHVVPPSLSIHSLAIQKR